MTSSSKPSPRLPLVHPLLSDAQHLNWFLIPIEHPAAGIERQMVVGEHLMICRFRFAPLLVTPQHAHPHEQISIVIEGRVRFFVEGAERLALAGRCASLSVKLPARGDDVRRGSRTHRHLHTSTGRLPRNEGIDPG